MERNNNSFYIEKRR